MGATSARASAPFSQAALATGVRGLGLLSAADPAFGAVGDDSTVNNGPFAAAVAVAATTGRKLVIPAAAGPYKTTAPIVLPSGVHLVMEPGAVIKPYGTGFSAIVIGGSAATSNVTIEGGEVRMDRATFLTGAEHGIAVPGTNSVTNLRIKGVTVHGCGGWGMQILGSVGQQNQYIEISGCRVYDVGAQGILCQDYNHDVNIHHNHVSRVARNFGGCPYITAGRTGDRNVVANNIIVGDGLEFDGESHGVSMEGYQHGFYVCSDNVIYNVKGFGVELHGRGACTGNTIEGGSNHGIVVDGNATDVHDGVTISGNTISNKAGGGIVVFVGGTVTVRNKNISIVGNTIRHLTHANYAAVHCTDATNVLITGNVIDDILASGIYAYRTSPLLIGPNILTNCNSSASATHAAIRILAATAQDGYSIDPACVIRGSGAPFGAGSQANDVHTTDEAGTNILVNDMRWHSMPTTAPTEHDRLWFNAGVLTRVA